MPVPQAFAAHSAPAASATSEASFNVLCFSLVAGRVIAVMSAGADAGARVPSSGNTIFSTEVADTDEFGGAWGYWDNLLPSPVLIDPNFWAGCQQPSMIELPSCSVCCLHPPLPVHLQDTSQQLSAGWRLMAPSQSHLLEVAEDCAHLVEGVLYQAFGVVVVQNSNGCCHGWDCAWASER